MKHGRNTPGRGIFLVLLLLFVAGMGTKTNRSPEKLKAIFHPVIIVNP